MWICFGLHYLTLHYYSVFEKYICRKFRGGNSKVPVFEFVLIPSLAFVVPFFFFFWGGGGGDSPHPHGTLEEINILLNPAGVEPNSS